MERGSAENALEPLTPVEDNTQSENNNNEDPISEEDNDDDSPIYSIHHLSAVLWPVMVTMALATAAVANIRDPVVDAQLQGGISTYLVYNSGSSSSSSSSSSGNNSGSSASAGTQFGEAAINALVIVCVICAATFGLVACYYFRCLKLLLAYLMLASTMLLGYSGGFMVYTFIRVYKIVIDLPTFLFIMWNFAITGVVSIYWQQGIPRYITQSYLIAVAVIMCWILSNFPEWTSWALLVMLALYDLCAVLTPCGPLRALIILAQERKDPIPGLLYEANTSDGGRGRDDDRPRDTLVMNSQPPLTTNRNTNSSMQSKLNPITSAIKGIEEGGKGGEELPSASSTVPSSSVSLPADFVRDWRPTNSNTNSIRLSINASSPSSHPPSSPSSSPSSSSPPPSSSSSSHVRIDTHSNILIESTSALQETETKLEEEEEEDRGIKLGLGDFVFYSVLVSRAGLFDASTMAACFTAVLLGLGGTLVLLGVFKKALPALPISIFLGILAYFSTRFAITPMIQELIVGGSI